VSQRDDIDRKECRRQTKKSRKELKSQQKANKAEGRKVAESNPFDLTDADNGVSEIASLNVASRVYTLETGLQVMSSMKLGQRSVRRCSKAALGRLAQNRGD
jgi:hypothetical protein